MTEADEQYAMGVRDGQRGDFFDDFENAMNILASPQYLKGYGYGVDHRYDPHGNRLHKWDGTGKNDPKQEAPQTRSSGSSFWDGLFGGSNTSHAAVQLEPTPKPEDEGEEEDDEEEENNTYYEPPREQPHQVVRRRRPRDIGPYAVIKGVTTPEQIKAAMKRNPYIGVRFERQKYLFTYKCDSCGHEFDGIGTDHPHDQERDCVMKCNSHSPNEFTLMGFIISLFAGKEVSGRARVIRKKSLYPQAKAG